MRAVMLACAALAASGCAPAPTPMAATRASEVLAQFAAGAAPADICTPEGRALLRGAVRAYSAEMAQAGIAWPASVAAAPEQLSKVDVVVQVAVVSGFVEAQDLRLRAEQALFDDWPDLRRMRGAARVACAEVAALQEAAARFVLERARYDWLSQQPDGDARVAERLELQARLMRRAQARLDMLKAQVDARVEAVRAAG